MEWNFYSDFFGNESFYYDNDDNDDNDTINVSLIATSLSWILSVIIITLNTIVLIIILRDERRKSRMYYFLIHLALADLGVGLLDVLPSAIERTVGYTRGKSDAFILGVEVCKIQRMIAMTVLLGSNFVLAAMSIDRALAVGKPLMLFGKGKWLQRISIAICWILAILLSIPQAVLRNIHFNDDVPVCNTRFDGSIQEIALKWTVMVYADFILVFFLPVCVIMASYTYLIIKIRRRGISQTVREDIDTARARSTEGRVFNRGVSRTKMKTIKLTFGIVLAFIVCWTPMFFWSLLEVHKLVERKPSITICMTLQYLNSAANPIMFFIFHWKCKLPKMSCISVVRTSSEEEKNGVTTNTLV